MPITEMEIKKIENGYLVEYEATDPETGEYEEVYIYFQEKASAILYVTELLV